MASVFQSVVRVPASRIGHKAGTGPAGQVPESRERDSPKPASQAGRRHSPGAEPTGPPRPKAWLAGHPGVGDAGLSQEFLRWLREASSKPSAGPKRKTGRPRTPEQVRELILKLARENIWGYTRIVGELRKLGLMKVSVSTVQNILRTNGFETGPKRGEGTWDDFLKRHARTLWQCDFLSVKSLTKSGFVDLYLLAFIHLESRRAWISPCTEHPDAAWVAQQARNIRMHAEDLGLKIGQVMHDRDAKFTRQFDDMLKAEQTEVIETAPMSPNLNAYVERFIRTVKHEALHQFVIVGQKHLNQIVREFLVHYNDERSHQARDSLPPTMTSTPEPIETIDLTDVVCTERLGGLFKHYSRRVA